MFVPFSHYVKPPILDFHPLGYILADLTTNIFPTYILKIFYIFFKLKMKWKPIHLPSFYILLLTDWSICPHNALESQLIPGFRACYLYPHLNFYIPLSYLKSILHWWLSSPKSYHHYLYALYYNSYNSFINW